MIQEILGRANQIPTREGQPIDLNSGQNQVISSATVQTQTQNEDGTMTTKTVSMNSQQNS